MKEIVMDLTPEAKFFYKNLKKLNEMGLGQSMHTTDGIRGALNRIRRFYERFENAQNESDKLDFAFSFFIFFYHLQEWFIILEKPKKKAWNRFFKSKIEMDISRDICLGMKHLKINKPSIDANFQFQNNFLAGEDDFVLDVIFKGTKYKVRDLMSATLSDISIFFGQQFPDLIKE